jgi:hypothetical protein
MYVRANGRMYRSYTSCCVQGEVRNAVAATGLAASSLLIRLCCDVSLRQRDPPMPPSMFRTKVSNVT